MQLAPRAMDRALRIAEFLAKAAALFGGAVVLAMALVTAVSVAGRALGGLGLRPVPGDFELVEIGCAIAVFSFLPLCQLRRGHVRVDLFAQVLPPRGYAALGLVGDLLLALCACVLVWRYWLGFGERFPLGGPALRAGLDLGPPPGFIETTYDLQIPIWIAVAAGLPGAALFALTCLLAVWQSANWCLSGAEPSRAPAG